VRGVDGALLSWAGLIQSASSSRSGGVSSRRTEHRAKAERIIEFIEGVVIEMLPTSPHEDVAGFLGVEFKFAIRCTHG
jgi:Uma2 family endonuclease